MPITRRQFTVTLTVGLTCGHRAFAVDPITLFTVFTAPLVFRFVDYFLMQSLNERLSQNTSVLQYAPPPDDIHAQFGPHWQLQTKPIRGETQYGTVAEVDSHVKSYFRDYPNSRPFADLNLHEMYGCVSSENQRQFGGIAVPTTRRYSPEQIGNGELKLALNAVSKRYDMSLKEFDPLYVRGVATADRSVKGIGVGALVQGKPTFLLA